MAEDVRRWLADRAKLERYFDQLSRAGFDTLEKCAGIEEADLDEVGIKLPGHRKRLLLCTKDLREIESTTLSQDRQPPPPSAGEQPPSVPSRPSSERRAHSPQQEETATSRNANLSPPPLPPADGVEDSDDPSVDAEALGPSTVTNGCERRPMPRPPKRGSSIRGLKSPPPSAATAAQRLSEISETPPPRNALAPIHPRSPSPTESASGGSSESSQQATSPVRSPTPSGASGDDGAEPAAPVTPARRTGSLRQAGSTSDKPSTSARAPSVPHRSSSVRRKGPAPRGGAALSPSPPPAAEAAADGVTDTVDAAEGDTTSKSSSSSSTRRQISSAVSSGHLALVGVGPGVSGGGGGPVSSSSSRPLPGMHRSKSDGRMAAMGVPVLPMLAGRTGTGSGGDDRARVLPPPQVTTEPPQLPPRVEVANQSSSDEQILAVSSLSSAAPPLPSREEPTTSTRPHPRALESASANVPTAPQHAQEHNQQQPVVPTRAPRPSKGDGPTPASRRTPEPPQPAADNRRDSTLRASIVDHHRPKTATTKSSSTLSLGPLNQSGYLWKTGSNKQDGGWRYRWMTFNGYHLTYYANKDKSKGEDAKGKISVKDMRSVQLEFTPNDTKHTYRILLETTDRTYNFATDDEVEAAEWMQCFKVAIDSYKPSLDETLEEGGHMANPDKQGMLLKQGHGIRADWKRRYVALKGQSFCYYHTIFDFRDDHPIHEIGMATAAVKPSQRNRFKLVTPNRTYEFQCDDVEEQQSWISALQSAILCGLADMAAAGGPGSENSGGAASRSKEILEAMYREPANRLCADCGASDPTWASCNLLVTVCIECSGIHRSLGVEVSKVRSVELDVNMWQSDLVELYTIIGNSVANNFWMTHCRSSPIDEESEMIIRDSYIRSKYAGAWVNRHPKWDDKDALSMELIGVVEQEDILASYKLLVAGASPSFVDPDRPDSLSCAAAVAQQTGNGPLIELVSQFTVASAISSPELVDSAMKSSRGSVVDDETAMACNGALHMTGICDRAFKPRHCELGAGALRAFKSDSERTLMASIYYEDMSAASCGEDALYARTDDHPFVFTVSTTFDQTYCFSATSDTEASRWATACRDVIATMEERGVTQTVRKCGHLLKRGAQGSAFRRRWFKLDADCKELVYHRDGEEAGSIDLSKMTTIQREGDKDGFFFNLVTTERTYMLQGECAEDVESWCAALSSSLVIGVDIGVQKLSKNSIPVLVEKCLTFIEANGMDSEGLYRVSGRKASMAKLKASFQSNASQVIIDTEVYSVHDVTGVLKDYFRNLPDPLFTSLHYKRLTAAAEISDHNEKLCALRDCICELPPVNYYTLKKMIGHLVCITENEVVTKMGISNLSIIFGPTFMTTESFAGGGLQSANFEFHVLSTCMTYYTWIFQVSDEERKTEKLVMEAMERMKKVSERTGMPSNNASQVFIVGVHVGPVSYGRTINANISSTVTASALVSNLLERQTLPVDEAEQYWPFVCILGDDLRRPLSSTEFVLPVCFGWGADLNAKLAVFSDITTLLNEKMALATGRISGQVQMKEKKGLRSRWLKKHCQVDGTVLTVSKDASSSASMTIDLSASYVYLGIENVKKAQPPTQFGITVTSRNEQVLDEARGLCFDDNESRITWLAAMYKALDMRFT